MTKIFSCWSGVIEKALGIIGKLNKAAMHLQRAAKATYAHEKPYRSPNRKRFVANTTDRRYFPSARRGTASLADLRSQLNAPRMPRTAKVARARSERCASKTKLGLAISSADCHIRRETTGPTAS
jgi:hypothetical protein